MKIRKVKVDDLFWTPYTAHDYQGNYLSRLFLDSTAVQGETVDGFFSKIWIPVKVYNEHGTFADDYTYYNCGMDTLELARLYWTKYSGNFLIGGHEAFDGVFQRLEIRCESIFKQYLGKYRKLVELEGLIWNPLWNVDGTELHQILEVHGNENHLSAESGSSANGRNAQDERDVTPYDSTDYNHEYKETHKGLDSSDGPSASAKYGDDKLTATGGAVSNVETSSSEARASRSHTTHDSIGYGVDEKDAAFGTAVKDGDLLHTEKTVRQGNIGVTKTTELISDARRTVAYSIIQEFFKDINKVILIGTYDN